MVTKSVFHFLKSSPTKNPFFENEFFYKPTIFWLFRIMINWSTLFGLLPKSTKIHFSDFFEPSSTKIHFLNFYQESTKNTLFSEIGNSLPVGKVSTMKPSILRLYCLKPSPSKKLNHILSHLILSYLMRNLMMEFY